MKRYKIKYSLSRRKMFTMRIVIVYLLALGSSSTKIHNHPVTSSPLSQAFSELLSGPLSSSWVFIVCDACNPETFDIKQALMQPNVPPVFVYQRNANFVQSNKDGGDAGINTMLPPLEVQKGWSVAVLVVNSTPSWLQKEMISWYFNSVVIINTNSSYNTEEILNNPVIKISKNLLVLDEYVRRNKTIVRLYSSKPFVKQGQQMKIFIGNWDKNVFTKFNQVFLDRFSNLQGETINIVTDYDDFPLVDGADNGMNIDIINTFSSWLNFTYTTTIEASDGLWGEFVNDTWIGMLGDIYSGNKHMTINYFTITPEMLQDFDSSIAYYWEGFAYAIKIPPPIPAWKNLLYPFAWQVWLSVLLVILILPLVMYFAFNLTRDENEPRDSFVDTYLYTIMSLLRQGVPHIPSRGVEKIAVMIWWLGGFIITMSYTSNLIAVLTIPVFPVKLSTVTDLASSSYRTGMLDYGVFVPEALCASEHAHLKALGERMDLFYLDQALYDPQIYYKDMIDHMLQGTHAISETYSYLRYLLRTSHAPPGSYYFLKEQVYSGSLAFFYQKDTPWSYKFDTGIRRLLEAGLINKWYKDTMGDEREATTENPNNALTLLHLQGPFSIYIVGVVLAIFVFVMEVSFKKCMRMTNNK